MTRYSGQPTDRIFVKGYELLSFTKILNSTQKSNICKVYGSLSFAKNMSKNIDKNIKKNLCGKNGQKLLDHTKKSAADAIKTSSERIIHVTGGLIGNENANRNMRV